MSHKTMLSKCEIHFFINEEEGLKVGEGKGEKKLYYVEVQMPLDECFHYVYLKCTAKIKKKLNKKKLVS